MNNVERFSDAASPHAVVYSCALAPPNLQVPGRHWEAAGHPSRATLQPVSCETIVDTNGTPVSVVYFGYSFLGHPEVCLLGPPLEVDDLLFCDDRNNLINNTGAVII